MQDHPMLSQAEWRLVLELLLREQENLPTEIHHTTREEYRADLRRRKHMVDELVGKLCPVPVD